MQSWALPSWFSIIQNQRLTTLLVPELYFLFFRRNEELKSVKSLLKYTPWKYYNELFINWFVFTWSENLSCQNRCFFYACCKITYMKQNETNQKLQKGTQRCKIYLVIECVQFPSVCNWNLVVSSTFRLPCYMQPRLH